MVHEVFLNWYKEQSINLKTPKRQKFHLIILSAWANWTLLKTPLLLWWSRDLKKVDKKIHNFVEGQKSYPENYFIAKIKWYKVLKLKLFLWKYKMIRNLRMANNAWTTKFAALVPVYLSCLIFFLITILLFLSINHTLSAHRPFLPY